MWVVLSMALAAPPELLGVSVHPALQVTDAGLSLADPGDTLVLHGVIREGGVAVGCALEGWDDRSCVADLPRGRRRLQLAGPLAEVSWWVEAEGEGTALQREGAFKGTDLGKLLLAVDLRQGGAWTTPGLSLRPEPGDVVYVRPEPDQVGPDALGTSLPLRVEPDTLDHWRCAALGAGTLDGLLTLSTVPAVAWLAVAEVRCSKADIGPRARGLCRDWRHTDRVTDTVQDWCTRWSASSADGGVVGGVVGGVIRVERPGIDRPECPMEPRSMERGQARPELPTLPERRVRWLSKPGPQFPRDAACFPKGTWRCDVTVELNAEGGMSYHAIGPCPLVFHGEILEALAKWRWRPVEVDGEPIAFRTHLAFDFVAED